MRTSFSWEGKGRHGSFHSWINAWVAVSASVIGLAHKEVLCQLSSTVTYVTRWCQPRVVAESHRVFCVLWCPGTGQVPTGPQRRASCAVHAEFDWHQRYGYVCRARRTDAQVCSGLSFLQSHFFLLTGKMCLRWRPVEANYCQYSGSFLCVFFCSFKDETKSYSKFSSSTQRLRQNERNVHPLSQFTVCLLAEQHPSPLTLRASLIQPTYLYTQNRQTKSYESEATTALTSPPWLRETLLVPTAVPPPPHNLRSSHRHNIDCILDTAVHLPSRDLSVVQFRGAIAVHDRTL